MGDPKERTSKTLRYDGGLIVTIKGSKSGAWYSHTEELGGGPIQAIQHYLGYDFKEALSFGAEICGLSESEAKQQSFSPSPIISKETNHKDERQMSIESAQSIWNGAVAAKGSLTETYFTKHRGVNDISNMSIRHWPEGSKWFNINEQGILEEKINKVPAAVIAARDPLGKVVGVQRIYLDKHTGAKNSFMKNAKLSKGVIKGMPGIIQEGIKGGVVYVAEGPETAASIALTNKDATVLTSFSVSNLSQIGTALEKYNPSEVIIAADNDGVHSKTKSTIEKAKHSLQEQGFNCKIIYPDMVQGLEKTDWNDVLKQAGFDGLVDEITKKTTLEQTLFERSQMASYTKLEQVIAEDYGLAGIDLGDVRFDEKRLKAIVPHYNENQAICGESVISLSGLGKANSVVQGSGYYVAYKLENSKTLYVTDNLLDAKTISAIEPDGMVILDLHNDLDLLHDWLSKKSLSFEKVVIVQNNHLEQTKRELSVKSQAFSQSGADVYLAKGASFDSSITHIRVHESFARANKIRGIESFVHSIKLDTARIEKSTLKSRFSKLLRQKDFDNHQAENVVSPAPLKAMPYYLTLSDKEKEAINCYIEAHRALGKGDTINHAEKRFEASQKLLSELAEKIKIVQRHSQSKCFKDKLMSADDISLLVSKNKSISLLDIKAIAKHADTVEMDKQTYQTVRHVSQLLQEKKRGLNPEIHALFNDEQKAFMANIAKAYRHQGIVASGKKYDDLVSLCKTINDKMRTINKQKQSDISQDKDRGR